MPSDAATPEFNGAHAPERTDRHARRRRLAVTAAAVAVAGGAVVAWSQSRPDGVPVDRAIGLIHDDGRFATARGAARALVQVTDVLAAEARRCRRDADRAEQHCRDLSSAAAFAQVAAVEAVSCTRPGIQDIRIGLSSYLNGIRDQPRGTTVTVPPLLPCRPVAP